MSDVRLSVAELPRSELAARSGVPGADGAVVSIESDVAGPLPDWLPAASVTLAVTDHAPVASAGEMSHDDATPTTYEQVRVVAP